MKALESKEKLVSVLSHDIRNPLGAILAYTDLLLSGDEELSPKASRQIEAIHRAAARIDGMIQKLVDISLLQSGALKIEPEKNDLRILLAELESRMSAAATRKNVTLKIMRPEKLPLAEFDHARILDVLGTIVHNAIQFSPSGSPVTIALSRNDSGVRIAVKDTGPGLRPDEIDAYCGPLSAEMARPARGLSLYLARQVLEAHGAKLTVRSTPGQGAEFAFVLRAPVHREGASVSRAPGKLKPSAGRRVVGRETHDLA